MLKRLLDSQDYYFYVHPKNEYNTTGKYELYTLDSTEPLIIGYWNILRAIIKERLISKYYY